MIKVLVTGATGFLGFRLALRLKKAGFAVTGLGRNQSKGRFLQLAGVEFISCDLSETDKMDQAFTGVTYVFHCAARSSVWGDYKLFYRDNVKGTENVASLCLKKGVKRLVYVSSPSIYFDFKDKLNIKESEPPTEHPANNYIRSKIMAEEVIDRAHEQGLDVITIRPRGIFGAGDRAILPRLLKANRERFIPRTRKEDILIDLTHVDNVVEAMILAMNADSRYSGHKYNITNGESVRMYRTLENVITGSGEKFNSRYMSYRLLFTVVRLTELFHKYILKKEPVFTVYSLGLLSFSQTLDISKARNELGYRPVISVEDGLREALSDRT
ncbi:MAG: NAD-dependent epimerase/dehydratase family protein [Ruminobacter sp.]|uniref:NAD-dependent epimerase/dehydratase family protein n=1 Tax=Succinimonas amylolytica TaxID=83769 RepID=UPI00036CE2DE|nr:NAD-dependent epimerase/dehydratase family protein [Succinimonas amylolytica]MBR1924544.1 NAD-dependent epimerase/dehydratase family protein [Ruminobacter sp.]